MLETNNTHQTTEAQEAIKQKVTQLQQKLKLYDMTLKSNPSHLQSYDGRAAVYAELFTTTSDISYANKAQEAYDTAISLSTTSAPHNHPLYLSKKSALHVKMNMLDLATQEITLAVSKFDNLINPQTASPKSPMSSIDISNIRTNIRNVLNLEEIQNSIKKQITDGTIPKDLAPKFSTYSNLPTTKFDMEINQVKARQSILEEKQKKFDSEMTRLEDLIGDSPLSKKERQEMENQIEELKNSFKLLSSKVDKNDPILENITAEITNLTRGQDMTKSSLLKVVQKVKEADESIAHIKEQLQDHTETLGVLATVTTEHNSHLEILSGTTAELHDAVGLMGATTTVDHQQHQTTDLQ